VNGSPHIGHALEKIQADAIARFYRFKKRDVYFLTGTDEHGVKIARAAEVAGKTTKEFVDENSQKFRNLKEALNLSWDNFIRTSDQEAHWPVAQEIWTRLVTAGDLYKKTYQGLYCVGHEAFVTQKDLVDGKCADHKKEPELISEENWFFKLSKYSKELESKIISNELKILPETRKNEILSLFKEGLEDISFSRPTKDLSWGVPVPGDATQTMYVWADALSNYISGYGGIKNWEANPADVHLVGKDILRFHAAIWPAMLLSAKLKLPKAIFVHGHIMVNGEKMSKSVGNVIDPFELVQKYGADPVRYYLLREISSGNDGDFSYEKFIERYNGDLANGLGNFAARVLTLCSAMEGLPADKLESEVALKIKETRSEVAKKFSEFRLNEAISSTWELLKFGDQYVNIHKPWDKAILPEQKIISLSNAVQILEELAALVSPFLPETSDKISKGISREDKLIRVTKIGNLFPRLEK
jgi:methionyl-tRNA synthetase